MFKSRRYETTDIEFSPAMDDSKKKRVVDAVVEEDEKEKERRRCLWNEKQQ